MTARRPRRVLLAMIALAAGLAAAPVPAALPWGAGSSELPTLAPMLEKATPADLSEIEISPEGFGLHFPRLDADLYVPGLLAGQLGSKAWMAARLGREGGKARTPAKQAAARANGKLGGRPRKITCPTIG